MTTEELQEKRTKLAGEIRQLADSFEQNGSKWPSGEKAKWDKVNADYDKVVAEMEEAGEVNGRLNQINGDGDSAPGPSIGRDDAKVGWQGGRATIGGNGRSGLANGSSEKPMTFRCAQTGREIRALAHNESVSEVYRPPNYFEGTKIPAIEDALMSMMLHRPVNISPTAYNAVIGGIDTSGGASLNPTLLPQVLDLPREDEVTSVSGARRIFITGETNLLQVTGDPVTQWRPESVPVKSSSPTYGLIRMIPKTIAALVSASLESLESSANAGQQIRDQLRKVMSQAVDQAVLSGSGAGDEPLGILNTDGVNTIDSVGTPSDWTDPSNAIKQVKLNNFNGPISDLAWISHPRDGATYDSLTDSTGQPLQMTPWISQVQKYSTTALPDDQGAGSESSAILGHFPDVVVGQVAGVRLQSFDSGTATDIDGNEINALTQLMRHIRIFMRIDVAVLRPANFTVMTGITDS